MYQFQIINDKYTGEIITTYNRAGVLIKFDASNTNAGAALVAAFKAAIPSTMEQLTETKWYTTPTKIIQVDYVFSFEDFWEKYPYKRNKYKAEEYWQRMSKGDQAEAMTNIDSYVKYCKANSKWYTPLIADTYLRNKEFKTNFNLVR